MQSEESSLEELRTPRVYSPISRPPITEMADRIGQTGALSTAMVPTRIRRLAHDFEAVLRNLAVSIADGSDCLSDLGVGAGQ